MSTKLTLTDTAEDGHYHVAYLNEETGVGYLSFEDHDHRVKWREAQEEQVDEQGNVIQEAIEEGWVVYPDEEGTHAHELLPEYVIKPPKRKEKEDDVVSDVWTLFLEWKAQERESRKRGLESERFYMGEQWPDEQKTFLEENRRACLTINVTQKSIDDLSGQQRQQRTDLAYGPVEEGDQFTADMYSAVVANILERCNFDMEESLVVEDQMIPGRGAFDVWVDTEDNILGEIKVERFPWDRVVFGPHEKLDASDAEGLIKENWYSMHRLQQMYPRKASKISRELALATEGGNEKYVKYVAGDQYDVPVETKTFDSLIAGSEAIVDIARKEFRVLECWRYVYFPVKIAVNIETEYACSLYGWDKRDIKKLETIQGFVTVDRTERKVRITRVAGRVLLTDEYPARLPAANFQTVPVYAKYRRGEFWGKVEIAKDPQREINHGFSHGTDILNRCANYGWFYDNNTFFDKNEERRFKKNASQPGFTAKVKNTRNIPVKVEGVRFPSELAEWMNQSRELCEMLLNTTTTPGGANESGSMFLQRQKQMLTGNEFLFDNLALAKRRLGRILIPLIQEYYSADRIARILIHQNKKNTVKLDGTPVDEFEIAELEKQIEIALQNTDPAQYDIVVTEAPHSPTRMMATYMLMVELAQTGTQIPPDILIELAPIPDRQKRDILARFQSDAQAAQAEAEAMKEMEENKTLIAQGIVPGETRGRLQAEEQELQQSQQDSQGQQQTFNQVTNYGADPYGGQPPEGY